MKEVEWRLTQAVAAAAAAAEKLAHRLAAAAAASRTFRLFLAPQSQAARRCRTLDAAGSAGPLYCCAQNVRVEDTDLRKGAAADGGGGDNTDRHGSKHVYSKGRGEEVYQ